MDDEVGAGPAPAGSALGGPERRTVPAGGLQVWAEPDAGQPPLGTVPEGTVVTVVGRRGRWVHVTAPDGTDGWGDGPQLAGVALGATAVDSPPPPVTPAAGSPEPSGVVLERARSPITFGRGPVIGVIGAGLVILGAALPWRRAVVDGAPESSAFDVPWRFVVDGFRALTEDGTGLGTVLLVVAVAAVVLSLVRGGGIVRRVLGVAVLLLCVGYVLQWQDFLATFANAGVGRGLNVWDLVGWGVVVSTAGGVVMLAAPTR